MVTNAARSQSTAKTSWLMVAACGVAAVAIASAAALAFVHFRERPPVAAPSASRCPLPKRRTFGSTGVLSPDGRRIAFEAPGTESAGPVVGSFTRRARCAAAAGN